MEPSQPRATWSSRRDDPEPPLGPLAGRLAPLAADRGTFVRELVLETCATLRTWVREQPLEWTWKEATPALDEGLAEWTRGQVWRGAAWRLAEVLHRARDLEAAGLAPRAVLNEELSLWLLGEEAGDELWSDEPLEDGRRLADPARSAQHAVLGGGAAARFGRGETVLALGFSEALALALERAWREGCEPRVLCGRGGACADGLRLARRLAASGLAVRVVWDAGTFARVGEVDRIWIATEATDAGQFLAPVGTTALLELARGIEVPAELVYTTDAVLPGGAVVQPPEWGERDGWRLWENAPQGVELESQPYEVTPLTRVRSLVTENGRRAPSVPGGHPGSFDRDVLVPASRRTRALLPTD